MGTLSARDLRGSARSPSGLPTKRHGRSLSEPDERAIGGSPRLPGGPRVWTPVTKRCCHSGGSAWLPGCALPATSAASAPAPWLASASGSFPAPGLGRPPVGARTPSHDAACRWHRSAWFPWAQPHPRPAARPQPRPHPRPSWAAARACSAAARSRESAQAGRASGSTGVQRMPAGRAGSRLPEDGLGEAPSGVGCWRAARSSCSQAPLSSEHCARTDLCVRVCRLCLVLGVSWAWGSRVCWEMILGAVPPCGPSPLALACLLGPCPPRALSARWWRPSSVGWSAAGGVSSVPHPPFPADHVVPFVLTAASRGRHCPRVSGDAGTQNLTCGLACGCGLSTVSFPWGAGMPPSASPVLQRGLGVCCLRRPGPGGCDPQVAPQGACVLPLADCAPPSPVAGDKGLGALRSVEVCVCAPSRGWSPDAGLHVLQAVKGPSLGRLCGGLWAGSALPRAQTLGCASTRERG